MALHLTSTRDSRICGSSAFDIISYRTSMEKESNKQEEKPETEEVPKPPQEVQAEPEEPPKPQPNPQQDPQGPKNETVPKDPQPPQTKENEQEQIRRFVVELHPQATEEEIIQFIQYQSQHEKPLTKDNFQEWQRSQHQEKPKAQDTTIEAAKQPVQKKEEPKVQTPQQVCEEFFNSHKTGEQLQIKQKIITHLNSIVPASLPITVNHVSTYLKTELPIHSFSNFKEWIKATQEKEVEDYVKQYQSTKSHTELQNNFTKITEILNLADSTKNNLTINLGLGENKGKTGFKFGLSLSNKKEEEMQVVVEVKMKKKLELKVLLEGEVKKWQKQETFNLFKLCHVDIVQTDKGLKITIRSSPFEHHICKDIIKLITSKQEQTVLKIEGQVTIKGSIRSDQTTLQKKKFMKWLCQGFTGHLSIDGSSQLIKHLASPLAEYFPIFKVVRSGEINLKTKNIANVDRLFQKLGISEISEETPTLHAFLTEIMRQTLSAQSFPWIPQLLKKSVHFASTIPNQRISIDVNGCLSHLNIHFSLSSQACRELGEIIQATTNELFS